MGATVPESAGLYFSWGNTDGHPKGGSYDFSSVNYSETSGASLTEDIPLSNDAAHVILGGKARIPTVEDLDELNQNCTHEWLAINGAFGLMLTSNLNGHQIFLPAAGAISRVTPDGYNTYGSYWTSKYENESRAYRLRFDSTHFDPQNDNSRYLGFTIRPIFDPNL